MISRQRGSKSVARRHPSGAVYWDVRRSALESLAVAILRGEVQTDTWDWSAFAAWAEGIRTPALRDDPYESVAELELPGGGVNVPSWRALVDDVCLRPHVRMRAGVGPAPGTPPVEDPYGFGTDDERSCA